MRIARFNSHPRDKARHNAFPPPWGRIVQTASLERIPNKAMNDWGFAQTDPREQLARLHFFTMKKLQDGAEVDVTITVKEFFKPRVTSLQFLAQADRQTNQKVAPYTPTGWGATMLEALSACIREINRFPHQPADGDSAAV